MQKNEQKAQADKKTYLEDVDKNLSKVQECYSNTKPPKEMLDYVSGIVHDIRTPANNLSGFLEILYEQIQDERLKEYIYNAQKSAELINDLTTSILDGVSTNREKECEEPTVIKTISYFKEIAEIFSANMYKKKINYNIFIDPLLPKEISLDSSKMKRVIMNLIGNAVKFTPENGSIEFSVRYKQNDKKLHIFVKDSGIGIAKENQEKIFEAFKQAEESTKDEFGGTGLGLSICASYVKEMGGKLLLESELNKGSTFYFDIPMDIKDYAKKFEPINDEEIFISILMDKKNSFVANHIARYLVKVGVNVDKISAINSLDKLNENTTHLIVFESKASRLLGSLI
jgi:signal transduction histidine kinase